MLLNDLGPQPGNQVTDYWHLGGRQPAGIRVTSGRQPVAARAALSPAFCQPGVRVAIWPGNAHTQKFAILFPIGQMVGWFSGGHGWSRVVKLPCH